MSPNVFAIAINLAVLWCVALGWTQTKQPTVYPRVIDHLVRPKRTDTRIIVCEGVFGQSAISLIYDVDPILVLSDFISLLVRWMGNLWNLLVLVLSPKEARGVCSVWLQINGAGKSLYHSIEILVTSWLSCFWNHFVFILFGMPGNSLSRYRINPEKAPFVGVFFSGC